MPGLGPGIHVLASAKEDMDGRGEPGHDESRVYFGNATGVSLNGPGSLPLLSPIT